MKTVPRVFCMAALLAGLLIGWIWQRLGNANQIELGGLYPVSIAQRIQRDLRTLSLLESNDVSGAVTVLKRDLADNVSALEMLTNVIVIDNKHIEALKQGVRYINAQEK